MSDAPATVSVVVPAYNEAASIAADLTQIREAMAGYPAWWELIVVDDGSTDETARIAEAMGATVIRHAVNQGTGAARKTGVRQARGEIVVMTDADGTYPNDQIPALLRHFPACDQVIGARIVERGTLRPLRAFAKGLLRLLASALAGASIPDPNSGLRAFRRDVMARHLYLINDGFSSVSSMTLVFIMAGYRVHFVPIDYFRRVGRSKFRPIRDTYRYFLTIVRLAAYFRPLQVFMPIALGMTALGLLKSLVDLLVFRTLQESDIILLLGGIIMGAVAILADTLALHRQHDVDRRP